MLTILIVSCALLIATSNGVYKKWPYNYLESFFYVQLIVFVGGAAYTRFNHTSITPVADTSIGLTLVVFLAVVGHHLLLRLRPLRRRYYLLQGYVDIQDDPLLSYERIND